MPTPERVVSDEVPDEQASGRPRHQGWPLGMPPGAEPKDDLPLEAAIFCHIFVLNSVLERTGNRVAEAYNLTLPQWMALGCIGHAGDGGQGLTHSELGQRLMLSKAPITGVVDRLERAGFVTRTTSPSDRRVSRIRTTEVGLRIWREVRDTLRAESMKHCECLGQEGKEQLLALLARLLEQAASSDPMLAAMRSSGTRRQTQVVQAQVLEAQPPGEIADEHTDEPDEEA